MAGFDGAHTSLLDSAATDIYGVSSPSLAAVCSQIVLRRRVRDRIHPPPFHLAGLAPTSDRGRRLHLADGADCSDGTPTINARDI